MGRWSALPLAGLLLAAAVVRAGRPAPLPPPRPEEPLLLLEAPAAAPEPPPVPAPPSTATPAAYVEPRLTAEELRALVEARLPEETILAYARVSGRDFRPTPEERAALRDAGMSDGLLGRLEGAPPPEAPPPAPIVVVQPVINVYVPVPVGVTQAPRAEPASEPPISGVALVCAHGRHGCCVPPVLDRPAIYGTPSPFKTRAFPPVKPLPTPEEVARRDAARASRIRR